jgi:RNA polymerase sigma-70 factor (ECF subfamily)
MQEGYVRAFQHLDEFAGEAKFSTWLTEIAIYEAMHRVRLKAKGLDRSRRQTRDWTS